MPWNGPRRLAAALAQAAGLKIKGVDKISTGIRIISPPGRGGTLPDGQGGRAPPAPTPIEVGEEEISAHIQAVFLVSP